MEQRAPLAAGGLAAAGPLAGAAPAAGGPALAVAVGRELAATVAEAVDGTVLLRVAGGVVQASGGAGLAPGMEVRLRVAEATADRVVLQLLGPDGEPAAAAGTGAPAQAAVTAGVLARALAARSAPPGEATDLAARFLSGEVSPVALLRGLAAAGTPNLAGLLAHAERLVVAGDGPALREALGVLGLDSERRRRRTAEAGAAPAAPDAKAALAEAGVPQPVSAQQLLLRPAGPALLFLPLPGGGEARVTIDDGAADPLKPLSLQLDLDLPRLGRIGVRLLGHDGALWAQVATADPAVAARLEGAAPALQQALAAATGRPARVGVSARAPEPAVVAAQAGAYA